MTQQLSTLRLMAERPGDVDRAADLLRAGELVAFPTETVYGLGADAASEEAVSKIFAAKERPSFNPLIVHGADLDMLRPLVEWNHDALALAGAFWPGPLTLVLAKREGAPVSERVSAGHPTVAVRVPEHPVAQALLRAVGRPLAAPSANPSGRISPTSADHVLAGLDGRIAAVLDGGPCEVGIESTIVDLRDGDLHLLRPGGIPVEAIEAAIGRRVVEPVSSQNPVAPGQLASHYAPIASVRLGVSQPEEGMFWIGFGHGCPGADLTLSETGDLHEAATRLFAVLREADARARGRTIGVAPVPEVGLGRAINDRLQRAAAPRD